MTNVKMTLPAKGFLKSKAIWLALANIALAAVDILGAADIFTPESAPIIAIVNGVLIGGVRFLTNQPVSSSPLADSRKAVEVEK
jgi:hypothetical protein